MAHGGQPDASPSLADQTDHSDGVYCGRAGNTVKLEAGPVFVRETDQYGPVKSDPASDQAVSEARPVFVDGLAQRVEAFSDPDTWIRHDLWVETEFDIDGDGLPDRMHVSVTRPLQTEYGLKLPVVYQSSPYYAGRSSTDRRYFWDVRQELYTEPNPREFPPPAERRVNRPVISNAMIDFWVPRGFIAVHSSAPGTGYSQGCPTIGTDIEALAPKAVIDWLNGRAKGYSSPFGEEEVEAYWTTGKVGMIGTSYNGTLALAAASTGVEGLEAIIPVAPNTSYYHYYRSNGLIVHPYGWMGEDIDFLYDFVHSNPENREYCNLTVRDTEMAEGMDRVTGNYNDFWARRDLAANLENLAAAVLMAHAFNDWNVMPEHSYRVIEVLKEMGLPHQIYYHQGGHGGNPPEDMMVKWFTRYLFDVDNGVEDDPVAWIVREGDDRLEPTPYEDYPHPGAAVVEFFLKPGAPETGSLVMERTPGQGTETLTDNFSFSGSALAQAEWTEHRLLYLTPQLEEEVHISGVPSVTIRLSVDRPAANLSVWLVSLPWNEGRNARITDNIITRGWADPQNRNCIIESEPLEPGRFYDVTFDLEPDDQVIRAGQQIGLMIFSSDKDFTLWPDPGTEITVDLDGTTLRLPVVGGREAVRF
ncbi:MAG: Xaa-Pro dipeptidyl-peptidase [Marinilabiliales bacterium]|nr:MAG: Xaa-Pro dipeptidyl-peptidase [Marinilabiliales bacterium]